MPWDNRLAPKPKNAFVAPQAPLGMSIPQASRPGVAQVDPRLGLGQTAQNVSAGVGQTLVGQLEGLQQLIQNPKATVSQMWGAAKAIGADPMIVVQMLRDARRKAMSGPIGFGEVAGEFLPSPGRAAPGPVRRMADLPNRFPRVDSIESMNVGPMRVKPRVIAEGKPLYRETSADGLGDYLRLDRQFEYGGGFVTDDPTLAIGQGRNTGVMLRFRPNAVSGEEHIKPGTGVIGGREYRADLIAPRAVDEVVLKNAKDWKRINALVQRNLAQNFTRVTNPDGSVTFTRKMED